MITVEGNDGSGKTTLVESLRAMGYLAADRGPMTPLTDLPGGDEFNAAVARCRESTIVLLDVPVEESRRRLAAAGKDLKERYHTEADLAHYRARFLELAPLAGATVIDATGTPDEVADRVLASLHARRKLVLALPSGRLFAHAEAVLAQSGRIVRGRPDRAYWANAGDVEVVLLKARSIPDAVAHGMADLGVCGEDSVRDSTVRDGLAVLASVHRASGARLAVLGGAEAPTVEGLIGENRIARIATEYPRIAAEWAASVGLRCMTVRTHGSTEAWVPRLADLALDVVETGDTARANGLRLLHDLGAVPTVLIGAWGRNGPHHHKVVADLRRVAESTADLRMMGEPRGRIRWEPQGLEAGR